MRPWLLLALVACAHTPPAERALVPGQLVVGTEAASEPAAVLEALTLDGYRFEYVAASSATSHLVRVTANDGGSLTEDATRELAAKLQGRAGLRYVELNGVRQPR